MMLLFTDKSDRSKNDKKALFLVDFFKIHRTKLVLLFFIPFVIFLITSLLQIQRLSSHTDKISSLEDLTGVAIYLSKILHESQKERGRTGIYLSAGETHSLEKLEEQRKLTDKIHRELTEHISSCQDMFLGNDFSSLLKDLNAEFANLPEFRKKVTAHSIGPDVGIRYYTALNQQILDVISMMINESVEPVLTKKLLAYIYFLKAKEKAGIERARLSAVFTRDYFLPNGFQELSTIIVQQSLYNREFYSLASLDQRIKFNEILSSSANIKAKTYRDIAYKNSQQGGFNVDSNAWFETQSNKIDILQALEIKIANDLISISENLKEKSIEEKWLWVLLLILITLAVIFLGLLLIKDINRSFLEKLNGYRTLFENSSTGIAVINADSKRFLYCNSYFSKMTGFDQKNISNLNIKYIYQDDIQNNPNESFDKLVMGKTTRIQKLLFKHSDGSTFYVDISAFPIFIQGNNYIAINVTNITDKLKAEDQLKKSERSLKSILNSLNLSVAVVDINTNETIYLNDLAEKTFRVANTSESDWPLLALDYNSKPESPHNNINKSMHQQLYSQYNKRWYQTTTQIVNWHDNREVCLRMLEDITERYDAEYKNRDLLIENRRLSLRNYSLQEQERKQLAADLHDQLGQMMLGIRLQAEYIFGSVEGKGSELESSAKSIIKTTAALMDSVQIITQRLRPIILDQLGIVEALSDLIQEWQQLNKLTVFTFIPCDIPIDIADQVGITIYRIVQEALTNINKHASAKNVNICIQYRPASPDFIYPNLILKVSDDGLGLKNSSSRDNAMGLINMRERVEALGGEFKIDSAEDCGVSIKAIIPLEMINEEVTCH